MEETTTQRDEELVHHDDAVIGRAIRWSLIALVLLAVIGGAVGDYDNDGRVDVFVTGIGGYRLFHNEGGGRFKDVTAAAGVAGSADDWGTGATFVDYDNDGKLDLFVCNYVRWSPQIDREVA